LPQARTLLGWRKLVKLTGRWRVNLKPDITVARFAVKDPSAHGKQLAIC